MHYFLGLALLVVGVSLGVCGSRWYGRRHEPPVPDADTAPEKEMVLAEIPEPQTEPVTLDEKDEVPEPPTETAISEEDLEFSKKLMELIEQRLDQRNLQMDMLASEMAMSHTSFYERVNRVMGESPATLVRNYRLSRAKDMLANGHFSVAEVALLCGFSDAKYFSTVFKKHYGVSPSRV